jgi:hypothetical protein
MKKEIEAAKDKLLQASSDSEPLSALVTAIKSLFPRMLTHKVGDHIEVNNGKGPILAIRIISEGKFKTSRNHNTSAPVLVEITSAPEWGAERLFQELAEMNSAEA